MFTDHNIVLANVSYHLAHGKVSTNSESHLLESGKRLKALNFNRAAWDEIKAELSEADWSEMEEAAKVSSTKALNVLMDELVPLLERNIPAKANQRKSRSRIDRRRKVTVE